MFLDNQPMYILGTQLITSSAFSLLIDVGPQDLHTRTEIGLDCYFQLGYITIETMTEPYPSRGN